MGMYQQAAEQMNIPNFGQSYRNALEIKDMQNRNALAQQQMERQQKLDQRDQMQYEAEAYLTALKTGDSKQAQQVMDMYGVEYQGEWKFKKKKDIVEFNLGGIKYRGPRKYALGVTGLLEMDGGGIDNEEDLHNALLHYATLDGVEMIEIAGNELVKYENLTNGTTTRRVQVGSPDYQKKLGGGWYQGTAPKKTGKEEDEGPDRNLIKDVKGYETELASEEINSNEAAAEPIIQAFNGVANKPYFYKFKPEVEIEGQTEGNFWGKNEPAMTERIDLPKLKDGTQVTLKDIRGVMRKKRLSFEDAINDIYIKLGLTPPYAK